MRKQLAKRIIDILENADFNILSNEKQNGEMVAELEYYSDAGEDFIMTVWHGGDMKSFVDAFNAYAIDFDPDDHAEMWVNCRGKVDGVPSSIRTLIDDADSIKEHLENTAFKLRKLVYA